MENNNPNQYAGRTKRQVTLIICGAVVILTFLIVSGLTIYNLSVTFKNDIPPLAGLVAFFGAILALSSITHSLFGLFIASDNIFNSSGEADSKANILHKNYYLQTQTFLSILIICILLSVNLKV